HVSTPRVTEISSYTTLLDSTAGLARRGVARHRAGSRGAAWHRAGSRGVAALSRSLHEVEPGAGRGRR
ncbi:hypothetical protein, partial [Kribbella deserti]